MKLIFHGGAGEVGRSCIEVVTKQSRFLVDCGVKFGDETEYPNVPKDLKNIDAAFLTHAHLDHSGALPYFQSKGLNCNIYGTQTTKHLAKFLLKDMYHVESLKQNPPWSKDNIFKVIDLFRVKQYNQKIQIKDATFEFYNSGHIPGSASLVIEADGQKIIYTSDINNAETRLLNGADINDIKDVDAVIIENTYGNREHPDRKKTEEELLNKITETLQRGGQAFIPSFAVGRAQEILLVVHSKKWNVPVYIDGSAKEATSIIIEQDSCKDRPKLMDAFNRTHVVEGRHEREKVLQRPGIFISTSGMMTGGPILDYMKSAYDNPKNSVLIVGYVEKGTNGRLLMEESCLFLDGKRYRVKAEHTQYDFSAHAGLSGLKEIGQKLNPRTFILVHGEDDSLKAMEAYQRSRKKEVYVPRLGSEINI